MFEEIYEEIKLERKFRDPIFGYIWVTEDERKIIDTLLFQRLRRISQLALERYVYPTAEHSRFTHSLGVLQSASNIFILLCKKYKEHVEEELTQSSLNIVEYFKLLRFTALLHDIGHLPFSHATEKVLLPKKEITHEVIGAYLIENEPTISRVIENNNLDIKLLKRTLMGSNPKTRLLQNIISGELDADRADYLLRDSHFCGVEYGKYDYDRYINAFVLSKKGLSIESGSVSIVESFLLARFHYKLQVPFHRTRVGYDIALRNFIKENLHYFLQKGGNISCSKSGRVSLDIDEFIFFDDYTIFEKIKEAFRKRNKWAQILMRQAHLRPRVDILLVNPDQKKKAKTILECLKNSDLVEMEDYFVVKKSLEIHGLKEVDTDENQEKEGQSGNILVVDPKGKGRPRYFTELSPIFSSLKKKPGTLYRIYVMPEKNQEFDKILQKAKSKNYK